MRPYTAQSLERGGLPATGGAVISTQATLRYMYFQVAFMMRKSGMQANDLAARGYLGPCAARSGELVVHDQRRLAAGGEVIVTPPCKFH